MAVWIEYKGIKTPLINFMGGISMGDWNELNIDDIGFGKSDLKTGMTVETRGDGLYKVMLDTPNGDILVQKNGWMPLHYWNEDLEFYDNDNDDWEWDIVRVYSPKLEYNTYQIDSLEDYNMVFNAEGAIKRDMTLEEIQEKLGFEINLVK